MPQDQKGRPAFAEDYDETSGQTVRGTRKSARARTSSERPKVHRESSSRKERKSRDDATYAADENALALQHHAVAKAQEKEMKLQRRMSTTPKTSSPRKSSDRSPTTHDRVYPKLSIPGNSRSMREDQSYYGVPTPTQVSSASSIPMNLPLRPSPRSSQTVPSYSSRPQSYHSSQVGYGMGPPLSQSAYYQPPPMQQPPAYPPSPAQSAFSAGGVRYAAPLQIQGQQQDYFNQQLVARPLAARFGDMVRTSPANDPVDRTRSAWGTRDTIGTRASPQSESHWGDMYDDDGGYNSASEVTTIRRPSGRRGSVLRNPPLTKDEDALAMPPPPRPHQGILRRTTDYPIEAPEVNDFSPRSEYPEPPRPRRPSGQRHSVSYNLDHGSERVTVEAANSGRRRHQSWYEQPGSVASSYEHQMHQAASYQEDVAGGPTAPLTAEMLRKQQKRQVGSSGSTKSSASRDESDYRKSVTTRTTRSGSENDNGNMYVKVSGSQARITVDSGGNTQIDCSDGGAVEIRRHKSQRNVGSERSSSAYGGRTIEDRPGRREERARPPPSRMSSQGRTSYMRTSPQHAQHDRDWF